MIEGNRWVGGGGVWLWGVGWGGEVAGGEMEGGGKWRQGGVRVRGGGAEGFRRSDSHIGLGGARRSKSQDLTWERSGMSPLSMPTCYR